MFILALHQALETLFSQPQVIATGGRKKREGKRLLELNGTVHTFRAAFLSDDEHI